MKALAFFLACVSVLGASVSADDAHWIFVEYHPHEQATIPCAAGLLCTVSFAPGEVLGDGFHSAPAQWNPQHAYSDNDSASGATPQLTVEPMVPGLHANFVVYGRNTGHAYHLMFVSTSDSRPTYVTFRFDDEKRAQRTRSPRPAPPPPTLEQTMAAACSTQTDGYAVQGPDYLRPRRVCHDFAHTYVELPPASTAIAALPVPYEDGPTGIVPVNYHFAEAERVYVLDVVSNIVLRAPNGRRTDELHIRRTAPTSASARSSRPSPLASTTQVAADPTLQALLEGNHGER
ncbi:MAG: TrbG/VirB9 family P-type conjugative transfer protein [Candidatus Velthaea sp.]